jgi:hypothetical protein
VALTALKEIDFDRETGKLSQADYEFLKAKYTALALEALREEEARPAITPTCVTCGPRPEPDALFCSTCGLRLTPAIKAHETAPAVEPIQHYRALPT